MEVRGRGGQPRGTAHGDDHYGIGAGKMLCPCRRGSPVDIPPRVAPSAPRNWRRSRGAHARRAASALARGRRVHDACKRPFHREAGCRSMSVCSSVRSAHPRTAPPKSEVPIFHDAEVNCSLPLRSFLGIGRAQRPLPLPRGRTAWSAWGQSRRCLGAVPVGEAPARLSSRLRQRHGSSLSGFLAYPSAPNFGRRTETLQPAPGTRYSALGRLAADVPLANRVRSGRKQP